MSTNTGELVILKTEALAGSVVAEFNNLNLKGGIRLLQMPVITMTNKADKSRAKNNYVGSPELYPITCECIVDQSIVKAISSLVQGINLQTVTIYQFTATGKSMSVLNEINLKNVFLTQVSVMFDVVYDQISGGGVKALLTFSSEEIIQVKNMYDNDNSVGQLGSLANRKNISGMAK